MQRKKQQEYDKAIQQLNATYSNTKLDDQKKALNKKWTYINELVDALNHLSTNPTTVATNLPLVIAGFNAKKTAFFPAEETNSLLFRYFDRLTVTSVQSIGQTIIKLLNLEVEKIIENVDLIDKKLKKPADYYSKRKAIEKQFPLEPVVELKTSSSSAISRKAKPEGKHIEEKKDLSLEEKRQAARTHRRQTTFVNTASNMFIKIDPPSFGRGAAPASTPTPDSGLSPPRPYRRKRAS